MGSGLMEGLQEALVALVPRLLAALDRLEHISRYMHPGRMPDPGPDDAALDEALNRIGTAEWPEGLTPFRDQLILAGASVRRAHDGLRGARDQMDVFRALRLQFRAVEALYPLAGVLPTVSRFFTEPSGSVPTGSHPNTGVYHFDNETGTRGGYSVYIPEWLRPGTAAPVAMALHGGSGHGRMFLWNWVREARSRGVIVIAPTSTGSTWSLMEPEIDAAHLARCLDQVRRQWTVDSSRLLLTGMSDGGTFTLLSGLDAGSPFTHLAPVAASFHPLLTAMAEPERIAGLPIYLVHGALDWMFPIQTGRMASEALTMAGAKVVFREIADLAHTYPRDENGAILQWLAGFSD